MAKMAPQPVAQERLPALVALPPPPPPPPRGLHSHRGLKEGGPLQVVAPEPVAKMAQAEGAPSLSVAPAEGAPAAPPSAQSDP